MHSAETEPLIAATKHTAYCDFLSKIVAPATLQAVKKAIHALPLTFQSLPATFVYPHRLALDDERCRKIETSLYDISRYIHAGSSGSIIENRYRELSIAINDPYDSPNQKKEYQLYAIRIMNRYGVTDKFAKMVSPSEHQPLSANTPEADRSTIVIAEGSQKNLQELLNELAHLDTEVEKWRQLAEKRNMPVLQTQCQKILRIVFKIFYFLFTIFGSGSGFLGGSRITDIVAGRDEVPEAVTYLCGFLGYLCWVFLFLSYRDSVQAISLSCRSIFIILFSAFTALPSALFAGINMQKIIDSFLSSAPEILKMLLPYLAQFSSFSANLVLNLGIIDLLLNIPRQISRFTHGVRLRNFGEFSLTSLSLGVAAGVGMAGVIPYISSSNLLPHVNLPGIVNLLLCVFGDLPSAMLGAVCLFSGAEPWAIFTNPQYRWAGRLSGLILGVIAPIIFFGFNVDIIEKEDGALHSLNHTVLYWFIQMLAGLGNFMAYSNLGLYIQNIFGEREIPPLFPPTRQEASEDSDSTPLLSNHSGESLA